MPDKQESGSTPEPVWLKELKEVREKAEDPVVDGLVAIGQHTMDTAETLEKRIDKTEERLDEIQRSNTKQLDGLAAAQEQGFKAVGARLDSMNKRQMISGAANVNPIFSAGDTLLAAIPEDCKGLVYDAERQIQASKRSTGRSIRRRGFEDMGDPAAMALTELWFKKAAQIQLPRYFGGRQSELHEQLKRFEKAFDDASPLTDAQKAAYAEGAAGTGGALVPVIVAAEILRIIQDSGVVVSRARHIPMTSDTLEIPNEATGITVYWVGEAGTLTGGENTVGVNTLNAKKIAGRATASIEVVEDSIVGLLPYIQTIMAEKIGKELDQEALEGDGTNFTGVNTESGVNSVATTTTDGETVAYEDLVTAVYSADESSIEDGAAWFMHRKQFGAIVNLVDGNSRPLFQPAVGGPADAAVGTILGFPVHTTSALDTAVTRGATGNTSNIYFGDPRRLIFGDRMGLRFDVTETGPGWEKFQVDMRLVGRFGFTVGTPAAFSKIVGGVILGG